MMVSGQLELVRIKGIKNVHKNHIPAAGASRRYTKGPRVVGYSIFSGVRPDYYDRNRIAGDVL
jgi:hypothetical protein